ncbi:MAG: helix-hairpin-helix domain-containing protein [Maribacter sp.]|uniref:ComEA family DNA-binding protein n=1 Tax=Maribacter sp. TaxID=1897614 RepID=UPI003C74806B
MKSLKSHLKFSKQERSGIFFLLGIIVVLQVILYGVKNASTDVEGNLSVDMETQGRIDSLKRKTLQQESIPLYPFNPNYISDYKGYTLGMSLEEIDRLHAYRSKNLFVNSAKEFQKVTQVSDTLLNRIAPFFKFPDWIKTKATDNQAPLVFDAEDEQGKNSESIQIKDLNTVTAAELRAVYGVGDKLSQRIVKFRDRLGGFFSDDQLYDVYGLEPEVVQRTLKRFKVMSQPQVVKININTASANEISRLIYISKTLAVKIVGYRENNGAFNSFGELNEIEGFPTQKIDRIKLYLAL